MIALNSSVHNPTLHIFNSGKICRVELCTELFYAIIPTLFVCFLLICYPYSFFFYSCKYKYLIALILQ